VDRLFEPFQRLGASRTSHQEGLGLGLSIVRAIATAHDAALAARPLASGGLAIEVSFPAIPATPAGPPGAAEPAGAGRLDGVPRPAGVAGPGIVAGPGAGD
jgi:hypothetical protein